MRELTLRVERPQIKINGQVFDLRLADIELYTRAQTLFEGLENFADLPHMPQEVLSTLQKVTDLLDESLGEGATRAISDGTPVSLPLAIEWLGALAGEAAAHYVDGVLEED